MSKKISLIIAVLVAFMGVLLVSSFGKLPEYLQVNIPMRELTFQDKNIITNSKGEKVYYIKLSQNNLSLNLYDMITYEPKDSTNIEVSFKLSNYNVAKITNTGMLIFEDSVVMNNSFTSLEVTITSKSNVSLKDKLTLVNSKFINSNSESYEDYIF